MENIKEGARAVGEKVAEASSHARYALSLAFNVSG